MKKRVGVFFTRRRREKGHLWGVGGSGILFLSLSKVRFSSHEREEEGKEAISE